MTGTLIERLEAVVARLEAMETQARSLDDTLLFGGVLPVLRFDGTVKFHWTHPSFEGPHLHAESDGCQVMTVAEANERLDRLKGMAFA